MKKPLKSILGLNLVLIAGCLVGISWAAHAMATSDFYSQSPSPDVSPVPGQSKKRMILAQKPKGLDQIALQILDELEETLSYITPERLNQVELIRSKVEGTPLSMGMIRGRMDIERTVYPTPEYLSALNLPNYYVRDEFRIFAQVGAQMSMNLMPALVVSGDVHGTAAHTFVSIHFVDQVGRGYKSGYFKRYGLPWNAIKDESLQTFSERPLGSAIMASDYLDLGATVGVGVGIGTLMNVPFAVMAREQGGKYWMGSRAVLKPSENMIEVVREHDKGFFTNSSVELTNPAWFLPYIPFIASREEKMSYQRRKWRFNPHSSTSETDAANFEVLLNRRAQPANELEPALTIEGEGNVARLSLYPYVTAKHINRHGEETIEADPAGLDNDQKFMHLYWLKQRGTKKITFSEFTGEVDEHVLKDLSLELQIRYLKIKRGHQLKRLMNRLSFLTSPNPNACVENLKEKNSIPPHELRFRLKLGQDAIQDLRTLDESKFSRRVQKVLRQVRNDKTLSWPKRLTRLIYRLGRNDKDDLLYQLFSTLRPSSYSLQVSLRPSQDTDATAESCVVTLGSGSAEINDPLDAYLGLEQVLKTDAPEYVPSTIKLSPAQGWGQ